MRPRATTLAAIGCTAALAAAAWAVEVPRDRLVAIFRPDRIAHVALAPDGRHVAYAVRDANGVGVVLRDVDTPAAKQAYLLNDDDPRGDAVVTITAVRWINNSEVIFVAAKERPNLPRREEMRVVDMAGLNRTLIDSRKVKIRFKPLEDTGLTSIQSADQDAQDRERNFGGRGELEDTFSRIAAAHAKLAELMGEPEGMWQAGALEYQRGLRLLGTDPADPKFVFVEAFGATGLETSVFRVGIYRGEPKEVRVLPGGMPVIYGRDGTPRLAEAAPRLISTRRPYRWWQSEKEGWVDLDDLTKPPQRLHFTHSRKDEYGRRSFPLALDSTGNVYFASNLEHDTFGLHRLDVRAGVATPVDVGPLTGDLCDPVEGFEAGVLVFDRDGSLAGVRLPGVSPRTHWFDPVVQRWQVLADEFFPGQTAQILEWDAAKTKALVLKTGPADAGRYFIFRPDPRPRFLEIARRLDADATTVASPSEPFEVTVDGIRLTGMVTAAKQPRVTPPPLVVWCRDVPGPGRISPIYDRQKQALAAMGFMVVEVNYRGISGLGLAHRAVGLADMGRVPAEDIWRALQALHPRHPFDRRRVALIGHGVGGYVAVRSLAVIPEGFRAAVAVDTPPDLSGLATRLGLPSAPGPALPGVPRLGQPVLVLSATESSGRLRDALSTAGSEVVYARLSRGFTLGDAETMAAVYQQIGAFLDDAMFGYRVNIGKERTVP